MAPPASRIIKAWEMAGAALALGLAWHFLALRARAGGLPRGDEGSWLSVAAELARGRGFTTRWLEAPFLVPYALPRPDDFRYPALTVLLAGVFRIAGFSVEAARWTVAGVFLAFAAAVWGTARAAYGRWAGMAALWLAACSPLQLEWGSKVYTESLFGLMACGLCAWGLWGGAATGEPWNEAARGRSGNDTGGAALPRWRRPAWWAGLGAGVGLLYLVRANGLLFLPGVFWLAWLRRRQIGWRHLAAAGAAFALVAGPWMLRTALRFGNPLHVAGNAGLLREAGQPHTYSVAEYLSHYDAFFPLRREALGLIRFFHTLHFYEHGLWAAPLALGLLAALRRRPFFDPAFALGCALTFAASAYAAYDSWAGVRYMSGLLPLIYAYGLGAAAVRAAPSVGPAPGPAARRSALAAAGAAGIALLLLPVLEPHRFYERKFARPADALGAALREHLDALGRLLPADGRYYAGSLCKVNFMLDGTGCVGLQELYDSAWFARSRAAFHPDLVALAREESGDSTVQGALRAMRAHGFALDTVGAGKLAVYLRLRPADGAGPERPEGLP